MSNKDNHKIQFFNGTAVVHNNGWSLLLADGRMFEIGTDKYMGKFDDKDQSPLLVLGEAGAEAHQPCLLEHYQFWCRFTRPKSKAA